MREKMGREIRQPLIQLVDDGRCNIEGKERGYRLLCHQTRHIEHVVATEPEESLNFGQRVSDFVQSLVILQLYQQVIVNFAPPNGESGDARL